MDSKGIIRKRLAQHRDIIEQILADEKLQDTIAQITDTIVTCFKYGGRVYFCGNGVSIRQRAEQLRKKLKYGTVTGI